MESFLCYSVFIGTHNKSKEIRPIDPQISQITQIFQSIINDEPKGFDTSWVAMDVALRVYLPFSYLKFKAKIGWTMYERLRALQITLFGRRDLPDLFRKKPPDICEAAVVFE